MSVTIVSHWRFRPDSDMDRGLVAAAEYTQYLKEEDPTALLCLWARDRADPLSYVQLAVFRTYEAFMMEAQSRASQGLLARLLPELSSEDAFRSAAYDVILSGGGILHPILLGQRTRRVLFVDEWRFKEDGDITVAMAGAADYVDAVSSEQRALLLSVWGRQREDPLFFSAFAVFESHRTSRRVRRSKEAERLMDRLLPEAAPVPSYAASEWQVILCTGGMIEPQKLRLELKRGAGWRPVERRTSF